MTGHMTAADAWAQIRRAHNSPWPEGQASKHRISNAVYDLRDALTVLEDLDDHGHWESWFGDNDEVRWAPDPHEMARDLAEQNVSDAGLELKRLLDQIETPMGRAA